MVKGYENVSMKDEAIELPLVQAELVPFDGAEEGQPPDEMEDETKASRGAVVRVVAPCDLPPNYKLQVAGSDGTTFVVTVPKQGVRKGQTFEAKKYGAVPVEGRFSDDLCSCGGEGTYCGVACCCIGLAYAGIMEKLQLNMCAGRSVSTQHPSNTFKIVAFLWFAYLAIYVIQNYVTLVGDEDLDTGSFLFVQTLLLVNLGLSIYFIVIQTKTRMAFRSKYIIPGNCCTDYLVSCCCSCCASLQMYRHMKRSGDPPARFATFTGVKAEIV